MQEYANYLRQAGYIISVYHSEGSDSVPTPGGTIVTVSGRYCHLSPNADLGFLQWEAELRAEQHPSHHTAPKL